VLSPSEKMKMAESSVCDSETTNLRSEIRESLRKIALRKKTSKKTRTPTSKLNRVQQKLTRLGQDAAERERWLEEDDELPVPKINGFHSCAEDPDVDLEDKATG